MRTVLQMDACKPRLLFVVNVAWFFVSHRLPLADAARTAGYEVHVAAGPDRQSDIDLIRGNGHVFHSLSVQRGRMGPISDLRFLLRLIWLLWSVRPVLVHHVTIKPVLYGSIAAIFYRSVKVINAVSGLGTVFLTAGWLATARRHLVTAAYRGLLTNARSWVIFQNRDDCHRFIKAGIVDRNRAVLIRGAGVDLERFRALPEPDTGAPVVVLPSRMIWDKGIEEFAAAARFLRNAGVVARFALVGGPDSGNPRSLTSTDIDRLVNSGAVEWWGHREDMPSVLAACHIVCLPTYAEGLPKVLLEAAACGRPIVASNCAGCREIVLDGDNGLLVPSRDPVALAAALRRLIKDKDLRRRYGCRGREIVERDFGVDKVVTESLELYARARAE